MKATGLAGRLQWQPCSAARSDIAWLDRVIKAFPKNPDLALYKLQMSAYKYSWLLIPISVPMLWLLLPFSRRFRLYDHTVFVTYSLAFMTLLALVVSIGDTLGVPAVDTVLLPGAGPYVPAVSRHLSGQPRRGVVADSGTGSARGCRAGAAHHRVIVCGT